MKTFAFHHWQSTCSHSIDCCSFSEPVQWINVHRDAKWTPIGYLVAGRFKQGTATNQLCNPYGFYIDDNLGIYIADSTNDRIMKWCYGATCGELIAGGNGKGDRSDQLNCPTDVIVDKTQELPDSSAII